MSVTAAFRVDIRPYSAYDDPGLPVAAWIAQAGIAGDASGGTVLIDFDFQLEAQPVSELYNLEQLAIDTDDSSAVDIMMQTQGMDQLAQTRPASPQKWSMTTDGVLGADSAVRLQDAKVGLPIWLGSPNNIDSNGTLRFIFLNSDGRLYAITAQGYMWGPRSILAPGGPRRPVGGLFGN